MEDSILVYAQMKYIGYEEVEGGCYNGYPYPKRLKICCRVRGKTSLINIYFKSTYSENLKSKLDKMVSSERYNFLLYLEPVLEKGKMYTQSARWEIYDIVQNKADSVN